MPDNKIPLGSPPPLSDKELDELAQVTDEDIAKAKKLWRQSVPDEFIDLLDAVPDAHIDNDLFLQIIANKAKKK